VLLIDDNDTVSIGSRAFATPSGRWRCGTAWAWASPMVDKGVSWKVGKRLLPRRAGLPVRPAARAGHKMPAMINLQQYYLEEMPGRCLRSSR
jgi:3-(3-hydroxy-phenyl)propionate hydroxylase